MSEIETFTFNPRQELLEVLAKNPVYNKIKHLFNRKIDGIGRYSADNFFNEIAKANLTIVNIKASDSLNRDEFGSALIVKVKDFSLNLDSNTIQITTENGLSYVLNPWAFKTNTFMPQTNEDKFLSINMWTQGSSFSISQINFHLVLA